MGAASPMGYSVAGKKTAAAHAPGMRKVMIEIILCRKEYPDFP